MKVQVKICGIRNFEGAKAAIDAGADFVGFNFVESSRRRISPKDAKKIIGRIKGQISTVGVFQNAELDYVNELVESLGLDYVQLHGNEDPKYVNGVKAKVIKTISMAKNVPVDQQSNLMKKYDAAYFMLDRETQGDGDMVDSENAKKIADKFTVFLAGGLNPENVLETVKKVNPFAVDVAGGIETNKIQDMNKIKLFVERAKGVSFTRSFGKLRMTPRQARGHFGKYGGRYVPEMLIPALEELESAYVEAKKDPEFKKEFKDLLKNFSGRPTPLLFVKNLTKLVGGAKIYLKNEGLNHTGAHKITHCIGQALIAKRLGKTRLIAETGAGQHGVATATVAAKFGFSCTVYMGEVDIKRQRPNVFLMEQLGAQVVPVKFGSRTLKDAVNAAIKDWIENVEDTHYLLGSVLGPHPYPTMNRDFQSIVGREIKKQIKEQEGILPDYVVACVGGGSNAMGAFTEFLKDKTTHLIAVEAGGRSKKIGEHATRFPEGSIGVVEGYKSYFLQDSDGQLQKTHSISAGLDYPGIGPELSYLHDTKRVEFVSETDSEVLKSVQLLAKLEGIIPALESAHAVSYAIRLAPTLSKDKIIVVNLSGRGDKDIFILAKAFKDKKFYEFMKDQVEEGY